VKIGGCSRNCNPDFHAKSSFCKPFAIFLNIQGEKAAKVGKARRPATATFISVLRVKATLILVIYVMGMIDDTLTPHDSFSAFTLFSKP